MALEAAKQLANKELKISGFMLTDAEFLAALTIPQLEAVETQLSLRVEQQNDIYTRDVTWFRFTLASYVDKKWVENCRGRVGVEYASDYAEVDGGREAKEKQIYQQELHQRAIGACLQPVVAPKFYSGLETNGYNFGPSFQTLQDIHIGSNEAIANVKIYSDLRVALDKHVIHPTTLDGLMHLIFTSLTSGGELTIATMVPTKVRSVWISSSGLSITDDPALDHNTIKAAARFSTSESAGSETDVCVLNHTGTSLLVQVTGLQFTKIASAVVDLASSGSRASELCRHIQWKPYLSLMGKDQVLDNCNNARTLETDKTEAFQGLDCLVYLSVAKTLQQIDAGKLVLSGSSTIQKYIDWMRLQMSLYDSGDLPNSQSSWKRLLIETDSLDLYCQAVEGASSRGKLFALVARNLNQFVTGNLDPLTVLFADDIMTQYYREINSADGFHALTRYLELLTHHNPNMTILEVGAGTGATTRFVLNALQQFGGSNYSRFDFTDISSSFFEQAMLDFCEFQGIKFLTLDIEQNPRKQGFKVETYDLIIASNVLHATKSLDKTLQHVRSLLKPLVTL
jgi:hypothetical protein